MTTLIGGMLAVTALVGATRSPAADVCQLLSADDVRAVQGATLRERKAGTQKIKALQFAQCTFVATEFARSISLTVISDAGGSKDAVRAFWEQTFDEEARERAVQASAKKEKEEKEAESRARQVSGIGREAFYSGDARAGSLYVLANGAIVRISVGGVPDEEERIRRSITLAQAVLRRLHR